MEMHLIFFKESCQTLTEAESQKNGVVTLAYFFDVRIKRTNNYNLYEQKQLIKHTTIIFKSLYANV